MAKESEEKKLKILMVMTANNNLGDSVLADCDRFLLERVLEDRPHIILPYSLVSDDLSQISYVDAVVFAGGILKTANESFYRHIPEIIEEADRLNIPVFMSAIGAEPLDMNDERSARLKAAVNLPCVKGISIRDDIETLTKDYLDPGSSVNVTPVTDPAVWCRDVYADVLPSKKEIKQNHVIGLGVSREKLFGDYGNPQIDREFQLDFWKRTAALLESKGYEWTIFTNGDSNDEIFATEVLSEIGHGSKLPAPENSTALVKNISGFRAVIGIRMHSNIISYALGIPAIGFIWNQKLRFWSERIGHPGRFMEVDAISPELAVQLMEKSLKEKTSPSRSVKKPVLNALNDFVKKHLVSRGITSDVEVKDHVYAPSLGTIDQRYKSTNSEKAFRQSVKEGFTFFQTDLRLTSDDVPVLISRWHKNTFKMFGLECEEDVPEALSLEEFKELKYYFRFPVLTLEDFINILITYPQNPIFRIIVSTGRPSKERFPLFYSGLKEMIENNPLTEIPFILKFEREADITRFKSLYPGFKVMYFFIFGSETGEALMKKYKEALKFCVSNKVSYISFKDSESAEEMIALARDASVRTCIEPISDTGRILALIEAGADLVGSSTYSAEHISRLIS